MMFNDELDPENEGSTTDTGEEEHTNDSATSIEDQQSGEAGEQVDWEARYKGLQRASEKKRKDLETKLEKANSNLAATTQLLEESKSDSTALESKQSEAEKAKTDLEAEVQKLQEEHDQLQRKIDQQNIVMNEFPHLAPVARFIPTASDEEGYRKGAEELSKAILSMVDKGVKTSLEGASATFEEGEEGELENQDQIDQAWDVIYETAGDPTKQEEYDAAFAIIRKAGQVPEI